VCGPMSVCVHSCVAFVCVVQIMCLSIITLSHVGLCVCANERVRAFVCVVQIMCLSLITLSQVGLCVCVCQ